MCVTRWLYNDDDDNVVASLQSSLSFLLHLLTLCSLSLSFLVPKQAHTYSTERTTWQILFPIFIFMLLREFSPLALLFFFLLYCYTHTHSGKTHRRTAEVSRHQQQQRRDINIQETFSVLIGILYVFSLSLTLQVRRRGAVAIKREEENWSCWNDTKAKKMCLNAEKKLTFHGSTPWRVRNISSTCMQT